METNFDAKGNFTTIGTLDTSALKPSKSGKVLQPKEYWLAEKHTANGYIWTVTTQVWCKPIVG